MSSRPSSLVLLNPVLTKFHRQGTFAERSAYRLQGGKARPLYADTSSFQ